MDIRAWGFQVLRTALTILIVLTNLGCGGRAAEKSPEVVVKELLAAIGANDTKTILANDFPFQQSIAQVRVNEPKFAQDAKIAALYDSAEKQLGLINAPENRYHDLRCFMAYHPSITVMEVRPVQFDDNSFGGRPFIMNEVYVKLTFSSPAESPYQAVYPPLLEKTKPVRDAVMKIQLRAGKFFAAESTPYYVIWPDVPSRLIGVWLDCAKTPSGDPSPHTGFSVWAYYTGAPPKRVVLIIAGRRVEMPIGNVSSADHGIATGWVTPNPVESSMPAVIETLMADNRVYTAQFTVAGFTRELKTELFLPADIVASPWKRINYPVRDTVFGPAFELRYDK